MINRNHRAPLYRFRAEDESLPLVHASGAYKTLLAAFLAVIMTGQTVWAVSGSAATGSSSISIEQTDQSDSSSGAFSDDELEELLSPIALYPDPLLAQVLPAATFVDQLDEASRVLQGRVNESQIESKEWDISVKSVAHYPQVLDRMVQNRDWTIAIGQAVVNQSTDVMKAVQRLRAQAKAAGNLESNDKMLVEEEPEDKAIRIDPAQPEMIYVPQYDPQVVYVERQGPSTGARIATGLLSFGAGMAIGAWLNRDCDWHRWGFPYHGWGAGWHSGWVRRSRVHIHINVRNYYINDRWRRTTFNRTIVRKNITTYRGRLRRDAVVRRDRTPNRNRLNRDRPVTRDNRNDVFRDRDRDRLDGYRGRDNRDRPETRDRPTPTTRDRPTPTTRERPAPTTRERPSDRRAKQPRLSGGSIFGGGGSSRDIRQQRNRGSDSRAKMRAPRMRAPSSRSRGMGGGRRRR